MLRQNAPEKVLPKVEIKIYQQPGLTSNLFSLPSRLPLRFERASVIIGL
jgi:hypothetical protein